MGGGAGKPSRLTVGIDALGMGAKAVDGGHAGYLDWDGEARWANTDVRVVAVNLEPEKGCKRVLQLSGGAKLDLPWGVQGNEDFEGKVEECSVKLTDDRHHTRRMGAGVSANIDLTHPSNTAVDAFADMAAIIGEGQGEATFIFQRPFVSIFLRECPGQTDRAYFSKMVIGVEFEGTLSVAGASGQAAGLQESTNVGIGSVGVSLGGHAERETGPMKYALNFKKQGPLIDTTRLEGQDLHGVRAYLDKWAASAQRTPEKWKVLYARVMPPLRRADDLAGGWNQSAGQEVMVNIAMVGNPGTGKSTILNAIAGRTCFRSGSKIGTGITYQLDMQNINGKLRLLDTPGLNDIKKRVKAAEEITKALKQGGVYKIFFVICLQNGRIQPDDLVTINIVLESAPDITEYGIIVTMCSKGILDKLSCPSDENESLTQRDDLLRMITLNVVRPTEHLHFVRRDHNIDGVDDANWELPGDLYDFIQSLKGIFIEPWKVADIDARAYEAKLAEVYEELAAKEQEVAAKEQAMAELAERINDMKQHMAARKRDMDQMAANENTMKTQIADMEHDMRQHMAARNRDMDQMAANENAMTTQIADMEQQMAQLRTKTKKPHIFKALAAGGAMAFAAGGVVVGTAGAMTAAAAGGVAAACAETYRASRV